MEEYIITDRRTCLTLMGGPKYLNDYCIQIYQTGEKDDRLLNPADIITSNNLTDPHKEYMQKYSLNGFMFLRDRVLFETTLNQNRDNVRIRGSPQYSV